MIDVCSTARALLIGALSLLPILPARADWSRQTLQTSQQTLGNSSVAVSLQRSSLNSVAATGIQASAPLMERGQWNPSAEFLPTVSGGIFSLQLSQEEAGRPAGQSRSEAPNRLEATRPPDGRLQAGPGQAASEVQLSIIQTYSVF
jgi:hypothetical protein